MSHFSYLVNLQDKTYCFLGKGSGWRLVNEAFECGYLDTFEDFVYFIENEIDYKKLNNERLEHIKTIYESIAWWPHDKMTVISDSEDDLFIMKCLGYKCIYSVFEKDIENLHLTMNKHMYVLSSSAAAEYSDFIKFYQ